jgi:aspartyl-tRNA(Asn)/glutamyl-tRNA(Gln) amidotransferase subunit A
VRESVEQVFAAAREAGAEMVEVAVPDMDAAIACYYVLATAEASSNLARYDGVRYGYRAPADSLVEMYERTREVGFGEEVKRRILLGTYVLSSGYYEAYYAKAQQVKALICNSFAKIFADVDVMLLPTAPTPAFKLGEKTDDPVAMYLSDIFTTTANIAGLPAISVPVGLSPEGLPVGMQLMAEPGGEEVLLGAAQGIEQLIRFRERFERRDAQEAGG